MYIYLIEINNKLKIGIASDVDRRFRQISLASGNKIDRACFRRCDDRKSARQEENRLHVNYSANRGIGEYFYQLDYNEVIQQLKHDKYTIRDYKTRRVIRVE